MWDNKLIPLPEATSKQMYARYKQVFGMDPPEDIEPTTDQIAAIKMLDDLRFVPGVDFSLFGPHGRRAIERVTYASQLWDPETNTYKRHDLPGPPDSDTWLRLWKVFKCTCLLLDICMVEPLDAYSDHIRSPSRTRSKALVHYPPSRFQTQRRIIRKMAHERGIKRGSLIYEPRP
jgi:hypothetical protein